MEGTGSLIPLLTWLLSISNIPLVEHLGKRIKATREKRGLSQEQLATAADISRGYLARLEIGRHDPTVGTLERIARALRVKIGDLLK